VLFTVASSNLLNVHDAKIINSPVPQMLLAKAALGQVGIWLMLIATLFTAVMTFNGGFATASRFLYAAAREATLPMAFARLNNRLVPWVTVIALAAASAAVAVVVTFSSAYGTLILVGAVLEGLIYAVAGLCVIRLRRLKRDTARSFVIPLGWTIPILSVIIFSLLAVLAAITPTPLPLAITIGIFVLAFLYVRLVVPRLKAAAAARHEARAARRPRRPQRAEAVSASAESEAIAASPMLGEASVGTEEETV
jgi:basic amino acid/polyamine antiporter, APA family